MLKAKVEWLEVRLGLRVLSLIIYYLLATSHVTLIDQQCPLLVQFFFKISVAFTSS